MQEFFVDLHIHIGSTSAGKPVKITGSKSLTIENILYEASEVKGMDMIGVIDCQVPDVIHSLEQMIVSGEVYELQEGGLRFKTVTLIPGVEIELYDENCQGPLHILVYMPTLEVMKHFSIWLSERMKNIHLSTQRIYAKAIDVQTKVKELEGLFIPAHVFTPFKSLYGSAVEKSLAEVFKPNMIDAVELGLSADTEMADQIKELRQYPFVTNSDAHSVAKIAREYQKVKMNVPSFNEFKKALKEQDGRRIASNYGLDPRLGKYHQTVCEKCAHFEIKEGICANCGHNRKVKGVFDRLQELKDGTEQTKNRPAYIHQVPLEFIPKLGPKTLEKLRNHFGTEMNILHNVPREALQLVIPEGIVDKIINARQGNLSFSVGGGGKYGKVK